MTIETETTTIETERSARPRPARSRVLAVITAFLLAVGVTVGGATSARAAGWPVLSSGSHGEDVTTAQYLLRSSGQSLAVDGAFGSGTAGAVTAFQSAKGLAADGVIGEATWGALTVTVRSGSTGDAVSAAQTQLNANGASLAVDGVFGAGTESAVTGFQSEAGLTADGIVGPATWKALIAGTGGGTTPPPSGDAATTAQAILDNPGIELYELGADAGADAASTSLVNIRDTAEGKPAKTSSGGDAGITEVSLDPAMLNGLLRLNTEYGFDLRVTSIAGEDHSTTSRHYTGHAVDIDRINGVTVLNGADHQAVQDACAALGATLTLGPGDPGHDNHVHCEW
ncbi:Peptidoglycan-binding (PGRP) domain of peptidoglycan hydrolases-containing protein [Rathayibacter rathayi NCPPB 2980 = VKM Ac-1601]|uniref:peptidoglycan-binding protein n=1 Tax=Rathayibacter rathayi TaxID=33887 RepID=UPI000BD00275|nr:peptidoglycan-binding protein [Rathayibacter rathayi]AZZ49403.1 peptidoglycan-binding protein [Rathayibacter rathayi]MWV73509.1 peptidoglycan-binding protein [Rathayibacter rathayi NCPPB 2980 = VKM Ac-1601]PPF45034.1 peptidoglycan-binding protein [Rathayibacter rathayi]PPG66253.1 peptidoglycan-binding protein [Rathayibacter rathayi]PPG75395.1 peptidoglycan-binding protein [Rathayibacter rathayi]